LSSTHSILITGFCIRVYSLMCLPLGQLKKTPVEPGVKQQLLA